MAGYLATVAKYQSRLYFEIRKKYAEHFGRERSNIRCFFWCPILMPFFLEFFKLFLKKDLTKSEPSCRTFGQSCTGKEPVGSNLNIPKLEKNASILHVHNPSLNVELTFL